MKRFYSSNNYVLDVKQDHEAIYIAESVRDAEKIAELMNLIPNYNPKTEKEQRYKRNV